MITAVGAGTPAQLPVRAAAEQPPFTRDSFDLVYATLSLRHWTNPHAGSAQVARVLTPGGVLVVADVFPASRRRRILAVPAPQRRVMPSRPNSPPCSPPTVWW